MPSLTRAQSFALLAPTPISDDLATKRLPYPLGGSIFGPVCVPAAPRAMSAETSAKVRAANSYAEAVDRALPFAAFIEGLPPAALGALATVRPLEQFRRRLVELLTDLDRVARVEHSAALHSSQASLRQSLADVTAAQSNERAIEWDPASDDPVARGHVAIEIWTVILDGAIDYLGQRAPDVRDPAFILGPAAYDAAIDGLLDIARGLDDVRDSAEARRLRDTAVATLLRAATTRMHFGASAPSCEDLVVISLHRSFDEVLAEARAIISVKDRSAALQTRYTQSEAALSHLAGLASIKRLLRSSTPLPRASLQVR